MLIYDFTVSYTQQTRDVHAMLGKCWASVADDGPALTQRCVNVPSLLGYSCHRITDLRVHLSISHFLEGVSNKSSVLHAGQRLAQCYASIHIDTQSTSFETAIGLSDVFYTFLVFITQQIEFLCAGCVLHLATKRSITAPSMQKM